MGLEFIKVVQHRSTALQMFEGGSAQGLTLSGMLQDDKAGPETEVDFWRSIAARLTGFMEQLKLPGARTALGVAAAGMSKAYSRWRQVDAQVCNACCWTLALPACKQPGLLLDAMCHTESSRAL